MLILHLTLGTTFLNSNNDVTGWGSLVIGSAIGTYITFAILIYSDASQKQISGIIFKQEDDFNKRKSNAFKKIKTNFEGTKNIFVELDKIENAIKSGNTSMYPNLERDKAILFRSLKRGFESNKYIVTTYSDVFTPEQTDEIHTISFEGIGYCNPDQEGVAKQTVSNMLSEIEDFLKKLPNE
jgi:hypothetical protein